jgi:hypothetical protein
MRRKNHTVDTKLGWSGATESRKATFRRLIGIPCWLAALVLHGRAQTEIFSFPTASPSYSVGTLGDVNSDGVQDFYAASMAISGRDGVVVWHSGYLGNQAASLHGDLDLDGQNDLISLVGFGSIVFLSARTGGILRSFSTGNGGSVAGIGDSNADGTPDLCVGFPSAGSSAGEVCAFSGVDGSPLWTATGTAANDSLGGVIARLLGDLDGDGATDLAAGASLYTRAISSATGATIWTAPTFTGNNATLAGLGDVTGDAIPDVAVGRGGGYLIVSGADGTIAQTVGGFSGVALTVARIADMNGDGVDDLVVGSSSSGPLGPDGDSVGVVEVRSGSTGTRLWSVSGTFSDPSLGVAVAGLGDITGDGVPEIIGASRDAVHVFSGGLLPSAVVSTIGVGCSPIGLAPTLGSSSPTIGRMFSAFVSGAYPSSPAILLCSAIPASPLAIANGCTWFLGAAPQTIAMGATSASGTWVYNSTLPYLPSLIGRQFAMQAAVLGAPRYQLTNGLHLLLGL